MTQTEFEAPQESDEDFGREMLEAMDRIAIAPSDWTVESLVSQIQRRTFDFTPPYQRRMAWRPDRQSRLIESLILGVPIPPILLAAQGRERFHIIDGKQRLLAIASFMAPEAISSEPLILTSLPILSELKGLTYSDFINEAQFDFARRRLETATIRTDVVRNWQENPNALFFMFHRINSETVKLSPQELRSSLNPGPFLAVLDEFSNDTSIFEDVYGFTRPDFRMRDIEIVLRFIAFNMFLSEYRGNMKEWLDAVTKDLNRRIEALTPTVRALLADFELAHRAALLIYGDNAFKRWDARNNRYIGQRNRALSDCQLYYLKHPETRDFLQTNSNVEIDTLKALCDNSQFIQSITSTTKSIENTHLRLEMWGNELRRRGAPVHQVPTLAENRINLGDA